MLMFFKIIVQLILYIYIYIYEMSSNNTRCNFVNVTPFLHCKFVGNLIVKKIY